MKNTINKLPLSMNIDTIGLIVYSWFDFESNFQTYRAVAQGLAHLVRDQGVGGSNPLCPKN